MCDQTEVSYLEDDIVWVKIGPIWWPGAVKDLEKDEEGRNILATLKKKPIAVVKFFQEDNYEFVKNLEHIYHYSCRRKDEFIRKGLDKFRTGAPHMKKFPTDVTTAESLTNGDVNIINDPKFYPEKKESYSEIFGSGKKKNKKDFASTPKSKGRSSSVTPYRPITHQRFINKALHGESDHKVKTLIQCNSNSEDAASGNPYKCHICKFETSRVNVIVAHHRLAHSSKNSINWTGEDSKLSRRKPVYKARKIKSKKLFDTSKDDSSDDEVLDKKKLSKIKNSKEKTKSPEKNKKEESPTSPFKRKTKEEGTYVSETKKPRFTDVLLADWSEDEEEIKDKKDENKDEIKDEIKDESKGESKNETNKSSTEEGESKTDNVAADSEAIENSEIPNKNQSEKMSCFDFDEEDEGFIGMSNANTYGRKIPRVIPVKDKTELGMDLEIEELFKKKSEEEYEDDHEKPVGEEENENDINSTENETKDDESLKEKDIKDKSTPGPGRRKRNKAGKEEETKTKSEDCLAMRRTRRLGAKKSYLNEVIEKIDDEDKPVSLNQEKAEAQISPPPHKIAREEGGSSSRRKQDFKIHNLDNDREEIVYSDIVNCEQKSKIDTSEKRKTKNQKGGKAVGDDLTAQIDSLLEETKLPNLSGIAESTDKAESPGRTESANITNFSFDYLPSEPPGKKSKTRTEVKSISRMFSDSIVTSEGHSDPGEDSQSHTENEESKDSADDKNSPNGQGKTTHMANSKVSQGASNSQNRGSIVLSTFPKGSEVALGQVKVVPVMRQGNTTKDCIVLPAMKKFDVKQGSEESEENLSEVEASPRTKNIKAIKVSSDSLPQSLITSGKLKGQTIIHQKGGKYVIVTQPPQGGRQRATPGKVQAGSKVVILTNQHGEQKIITASGLQTKFKVDGQKIVSASEVLTDSGNGSTSSGAPGQAQPVIKMVPDGKGGIMKQLTVSPKKVLLGGTKVLVSASGSSLSSGSTVQKIALSSAGGVARAASGDYRLIENYKGSGKTVLIQGGPNSSTGVVLKPSSSLPRQVTKVLQSPQTISSLKKKPKILMRASAGQNEFVMQTASGSIEAPTFVVKQKGSDGKFSTQKIVRTEVLSQSKASGSGTKTFFLSGQSASKLGESYIITTNESVPGKVIRMRQKIKEVDSSAAKIPQKVIQKVPEVYSLAPNSLLLQGQTSAEDEASQLVQIQDQPQEPVLQTQVIAMPGPVGADGNQTYVLVSVDENGVVQGMDNSMVTYDTTAQQDQIFVNPTSTNNVILINPNEEVTPAFSTSSQDILAEALANTNVLEGTINNEIESVVPSILLPPAIPSSVVQETSITLQKPIMTPLEMPSSVAPDTSGLEPPPLPPTPTEEDVLMEDTEVAAGENLNQENSAFSNKKEGETTSNNTIQSFLEPEGFDSDESAFHGSAFAKAAECNKMSENQFEEEEKSEVDGEAKQSEFYQAGEIIENASSDQGLPREEFMIENSQEEQTTSSFQSLPILNDEPDTSDDAQGSEPIGDQHFDSEKSRMESSEFSQLLRDQEPPSSTNNDMIVENNHDSSKYDDYQSYKTDSHEPKKKDVEEETVEEQIPGDGAAKEKDVGTRESESLPIIADESNANAYEMEPIYSDVISQKRFQEETEVSSTTDEFAHKDLGN